MDSSTLALSRESLLFLPWLLGIVALSLFAARRHRALWRQTVSPAFATAVPSWTQELFDEAADRLGLRRRVRLIVVRHALGPAVVGVLRPIVVLPAAFLASQTRREVEHVLLHELAHVKRRDPLAALVCQVLAIGFWFHPALWIAQRRMRAIREMCCDQLAAAISGVETRDYQRTLLVVSRPLWSPSAAGAAMAFFPARSHLVERVERLSRPVRAKPPLRFAMTALAAIAFGACVLPLAAAPQPGERERDTTMPAPPDASHELEGERDFGERETIDLDGNDDGRGSDVPKAVPAAANSPLSDYQPPPLDQLQGCLQLRFAVMAHMAKRSEAAPQSQ